MKYLIICALFFISSKDVISQSIVVGDSIKVTFSHLHAVDKVRDISDLDFSITTTNVSLRPIRTYTSLWLDETPSPFGNYDCKLIKKADTGYTIVDHYSHTPIYQYLIDSLRQMYSAATADSIIRVFDFNKDFLDSGSSRTLNFNLLSNNIYLDPGIYKVQIVYRVGAEFRKTLNGRLERHFNYIYSDWYRFSIDTRLMVPMTKPQNVSHREDKVSK